MFGRVVESLVCRILREGPVRVGPEDSPDAIWTPLDGEGRPSRDREIWPTIPGLRSPETWPHNREDLSAWCLSRIEMHISGVWENAKQEWEQEVNRTGEWDDLNEGDVTGMVMAALEFQIDEVERALGSPDSEEWKIWRSGHRPKWPPPDGWAPDAAPESILRKAEPSLAIAWEVSRPWFVDPDAKTFTLGAVHPEHWFNGEYDLVHTWDGRTRIIDIKASKGTSDYAGGYPEQLRIYAWLWNRNHPEKKVDGLEIWYLGIPEIVYIEVPKDDEILAMEDEMREVHKQLLLSDRKMDDFPANPTSLKRFEPGGLIIAEEMPSLERCAQCDHRLICDSSGVKKNLLNPRELSHTSRNVEFTPMGEIESRLPVTGTIASLVGLSKKWPDFELRTKRGTTSVFVRGMEIDTIRNFSVGENIHLEKARIEPRYRGPVVIIDEHSSIQYSEGIEQGGVEPTVHLMRKDIIGEVISLGASEWIRNDGGIGRNWRATLIDNSGAMEVIAYDSDIDDGMRAIRRGEIVQVERGIISERDGWPQLKVDESSTVRWIPSEGAE